MMKCIVMLVHVDAHEDSRRVPGGRGGGLLRVPPNTGAVIPFNSAPPLSLQRAQIRSHHRFPPAEATSKAVTRFWDSGEVTATHELIQRRNQVDEHQRAPAGGV